MTDDPRRLLETSVAYMRLALHEGGLPLDVPGGRAYGCREASASTTPKSS